MAGVRSFDSHVARILEHVSDGVVILDPDWCVRYVNAEAARLLRRGPDTLLDRALWEEFPEAVGTVFWDAIHRAMATRESQTVEAHYDPLAGWFEVRIVPMADGVVVYFRDVTERRHTNDERKKLVGRLTAALHRSQQHFELTDALARALTLEDVASLVTKHAQRALGCRFAGVALVDEERSMLRYVSMAPLPPDVARKWSEFPLDADVPAGETVRRSEAQRYADREEILRDYPHLRADLEAAGTQGMANLPLIASGRTIGALMITWDKPHACAEEEVRFLQTLAGQSAQAIERASLLTRQQTVAETLQRAILPHELPSGAGVDLAARYEPAQSDTDVGGDWYDAFVMPDGRLALTVGDVAGHGLDAAALMGQLRNAARAYAVDELEPGALVTKLNRLLSDVPEGLLATLIFATLDPRTGALRWSNAGHPPPVALGADATARFLEDVHGPPLGADATATFATSHGTVAGGALVLYTDGLIEQRTRSISDGLTALCCAVGTTDRADLERFCDEVADRVLPSSEREDDMCLLVVSHRGS